MSFVSNFAFIAKQEPMVADLGRRAEQSFADDPNVTLIRLRQLIERLAKAVAERHRMHVAEDTNTFQLVQELFRRDYCGRFEASLFHKVRKAGNDAVHEFVGDHSQAASQLRNARNLCMWFEAVFGNPGFKPKPFALPPPPPDPSEAIARAHAQQEALEARLAASEAERSAYEARIAEQAERLGQPRVVFASEFMAAWNALDDAGRESMADALHAFRDQPVLAVLAPLDECDPAFTWLALHNEHGAIVVTSPAGDVCLMTWVGDRSSALRWAARRRVEVNPRLGSLQVYELVEAPTQVPAAGLFASHSDDVLQDCGVPTVLLPAVRAVADRGALSAMAGFLPAEAADVLFAIADGQDPVDARRDAGLRTATTPVDTTDFDAALSHNASKRAFTELDDERFQQMLKAPLEQWRLFLHPSQAKVVQMAAKGPVRVLGGAGTGKTVALLHRTAHLLRHVLDTHAQVVVTTYTSTMALELRADLQRLLTPDELQRVTACTLHKWCATYLRSLGTRVHVVSSKDQKAWFDAAVREHGDPQRPARFYRDEWDLVVQAQGVQSRADYFRARRQGRGTRLNRRGRAAAWEVFAAYRAALDTANKVEWGDLIRLARQALVADDTPRPVRAVLVDEVQDFGQAELQLIRAMVDEQPADLFLVGDAHQRIYTLGCSFGKCGIHVRGRSHRLKVNYRTTERIQTFAMGVLAGAVVDDLDGGEDTLSGYHSLRLGQAPTVRLFGTADAERQAVVNTVSQWLSEGVAPTELVIAARTSWMLSAYRKALEAAAIPVANLSQRGDLPGNAVRLSTMHRLKGTEFSRVLLVGVHDGAVPLQLSAHADDAAHEDHLLSERCLLYVAATRARDELAVTGVGGLSPLLTER